MSFFQWITDYQVYKRNALNKRDIDSYDVFVANRQRQLEAAGMPTYRLLSEMAWVEDGLPYYNVHPRLVSKLCKVDMNKIPSTLLKTPHGLRVVNIRFSEKHSEFSTKDEMKTDFISGGHPVQTIPAETFVHSVLMLDFTIKKRCILFLMDFNVYSSLGQPFYTIFSILPQEGMSLEESIGNAKGPQHGESYSFIMKNVMRLCVSIGFLADNPTICEPDILSSDRNEFKNSNDDRKQHLVNRAKRKGKNGFNIGTDIMFLGERPMVSSGLCGELTGRELEHAHIRAGHPHLVRYGEEKKLVKMMWYVPTTVRPDKPFKS